MEQVRGKEWWKDRNTEQMKEQDRNSQDRINEEEINRFPKTEFRLMIVKVPQSLENRMEKCNKYWTQLIHSSRT